MTKQTEAQRLAAALDSDRIPYPQHYINQAAAELLRLEAANAELLEALAVAGVALRIGHNQLTAIEKVSAAIAKHGGQA